MTGHVGLLPFHCRKTISLCTLKKIHFCLYFTKSVERKRTSQCHRHNQNKLHYSLDCCLYFAIFYALYAHLCAFSVSMANPYSLQISVCHIYHIFTTASGKVCKEICNLSRCVDQENKENSRCHCLLCYYKMRNGLCSWKTLRKQSSS